MTTASTEDRRERAAQNQSLFRDINERIRDMNEKSHVFKLLGDWICECANETCVERLSLSTRAYDAIRQHGARFLVAPSDQHVWAEVERVIEMNDEYWIVEKFGRAAAITGRSDPRSDQHPPATSV